jgi:hypothetical protein
VATKVEGVFKKRRSYSTLDGVPLLPEQLNEMKRIARAKLEPKTDARSQPSSNELQRRSTQQAKPANFAGSSIADIRERSSFPSGPYRTFKIGDASVGATYKRANNRQKIWIKMDNRSHGTACYDSYEGRWNGEACQDFNPNEVVQQAG